MKKLGRLFEPAALAVWEADIIRYARPPES